MYRTTGGSWTPHEVGSTDIADIRQRTPDDVWAVGKAPSDRFPSHAYAACYDGSTWHDMTPPQFAGEEAGLTAVLPLAADDVWAIGYSRGAAGSHEPRSYHWDGSAWQDAPVPSGTRFQGALVDDGAGGLWATANSGGDDVGLMHYSGGAWTRGPVLPDSAASLNDLARVPGTSTILAAGTRDGKPLVIAKD